MSKTVTLRVTEGEIALLEMALIDMSNLNEESVRKAPILPDNADAARRLAARERVRKATAVLQRKVENAGERIRWQGTA